MADEIKKIITVDVSGAVSSLSEMKEETEATGYSFKSLGDAKKYIDKLRASLIDLDEASDEYAETVEEIDKVQKKLTAAMKATASSSKDAEGSYNSLSKQMSELKKAWKETADEAERNRIGKQIVTINDKLKDMDASVGNYQRNVGNYSSAFTQGLDDIGEKIKALGNPLALAKKGVTALGSAFKALIANPVGAFILAIVTAVKLLKSGFENSETATNSLKRAFAAFEPVINIVKNAITGFANIVGTIAEKAIPAMVNAIQSAGSWIMKFLNTLHIVSDEELEAFNQNIEAQKEASKTTQELADREINQQKRKREFLVEEANMENQIAELRNKNAQKDKYNEEQRKKFLEEAIAVESALADKRVAIAQEDYNILKKKSELTDNDAATNDALAAAEANVIRAKTDRLNKERELNAQRAELNLKIQASDKEVTETVVEEDDKQLKEQEELNKKLDEIQDRAELSLKDATEREIELLTRKYEEEKKLLEENGRDTINLTKEYQNKVADLKSNKAISEGTAEIKDVDTDTALETFIADKTVQIEYDKEQRILEIQENALQRKREIYDEMSKNLDIEASKREEFAQKVKEIDIQLDDNAKQRAISEKEHINEIVQTYSQAANSIGDLMGTISEIWQNSITERLKNGKISEEQAKKEFEQSKKLQIASALITGLAGVAAALACTFTTKTGVWDIALGVAQAATIAANTALQISKIKSTTFDGGGTVSAESATASTPSSSATAYTPNYSTNITGESDTVNLANAVKEGQSSTRVYVLESDIEQAQNKVQVRETESTF